MLAIHTYLLVNAGYKAVSLPRYCFAVLSPPIKSAFLLVPLLLLLRALSSVVAVADEEIKIAFAENPEL